MFCVYTKILPAGGILFFMEDTVLKQNESSLTSLVAAFGRAYHSIYDTPKIFNDDLAQAFLSPQEFTDISRNMVQGIDFFNPDYANEHQDDQEAILRWIVQIFLSPTPLARAAYCEAALLHELTLGLKQYVILSLCPWISPGSSRIPVWSMKDLILTPKPSSAS